jgi:hypothetical protein
MTNSLLVVAAVTAISLGSPMAASAAQTTLTNAHSPRAETVQKADYNWHHRQWHHRRWVQHQRYRHYYN